MLGRCFFAAGGGSFLSYQVIARKWRPQKFDELVGQNHISQTLSNALRNGRLPHALLFTGPRGTGKTSSARILAKSLRCSNAVEFTPCGKCDSCLDIALSRSTDVIEIDGASNNGVDAIRELREGVVFMPSSGKYKVYIIDEVHMLSTSAFNALLKTLEEPPEHVIFIMATTEVQKIPQTILSRCQRFDFRRISTRTIVDRMSFICKEESISADEESLWTIARQGDGSMRDSLSLLDQVITFSNGPLKASSVVDILGLTERSLLTGVLSSLIARQPQEILGYLEKLSNSGTEPHLFLTDLLELIRATLLVKISGEQKPAMLDIPDSELRFLKDLCATCSEEDLHLLFDMSLKGLQDLQRSSEPRIVLEMILLRMAAAPQIIELKKLLAGEISGATTAAPMTTARPAQPTASASVQRPAPHGPPPPAPVKTSRAALTPSEKWFEFVQTIKADEPLMGAKVENLLFVGEINKVLELAIPQKMGFLSDQMSDPALRKKLQNMIETSWGPGYALEIKQEDKKAEGALSASGLGQAKEKLKEDDLLKQATEHPKVKSATSVFKGSIQLKDADKAKERS